MFLLNLVTILIEGLIKEDSSEIKKIMIEIIKKLGINLDNLITIKENMSHESVPLFVQLAILIIILVLIILFFFYYIKNKNINQTENLDEIVTKINENVFIEMDKLATELNANQSQFFKQIEDKLKFNSNATDPNQFHTMFNKFQMPSAPLTNFPSAPLTNFLSAPLTNLASAPLTNLASAPLADSPSSTLTNLASASASNTILGKDDPNEKINCGFCLAPILRKNLESHLKNNKSCVDKQKITTTH